MVAALQDEKSYIDVKRCMMVLGLKKPDLVHRAIASGDLPATNISSGHSRPTWRIDPADLASFLTARRTSPPALPRRTRRKPATGITKYF